MFALFLIFGFLCGVMGGFIGAMLGWRRARSVYRGG